MPRGKCAKRGKIRKILGGGIGAVNKASQGNMLLLKFAENSQKQEITSYVS